MLAGLGMLLGAVTLEFKAEHVQHMRALAPDAANAYSTAGVVLGGVGGFGFLGAGALAHARHPDNRVGLLMVLVGVAFFAEDVQLSGNDWVHSVGILVARASSGFVVHLVLAFPDGRLASRSTRMVAGAAYVAAFVFTPVAALFNDARRAEVFPANRILIAGGTPVHHVLGRVVEAIGAVVTVAVVAVLIRRWVQAGPPMRRVLAPVFLAGMLGGVGTVAVGAVDGQRTLDEAFSWVPRVAFCLLPLGFLIGVWRVRLGRTAVGTLLAQLRRPLSAAQLRGALARAVGDPSLQVGYWRPDTQRFVDGDGQPMQVPDADPGGGVTLVEPGGRRVAVLVHDPALREDTHVLDAVVAAAELALENQRLAAEVRAQLAEVRDLAGRLVAAGDAERRRLERDLHDGAQQGLVAVALSLRLAMQRLEGTADARTTALLANSAAGLTTVINDLRELARGIHPAILTDAGLVAAVHALVERTPEPGIRIHASDVPRLPAAEEATGYFVTAEALTNALKYSYAEHIVITIEYGEDLVRITIVDDGVGGAGDHAGSGLRGLRDRVTALGGTLSLHSPPGLGTSVSVAIPCRAAGRRAAAERS